MNGLFELMSELHMRVSMVTMRQDEVFSPVRYVLICKKTKTFLPLHKLCSRDGESCNFYVNGTSHFCYIVFTSIACHLSTRNEITNNSILV